MATADELLRRHNPLLVIFPADPGRVRPGSQRPGPAGWGDYLPCSAELFLDSATYRRRPRGYSPLRLLLGPERLTPTGRDEICRQVTQGAAGATRDFELDLSTIPSQDEERAWEEYLELTQSHQAPPVAYGRFFRGASGVALQYWYLYLYNDFVNNHEGDWEMAVVELGPDDGPVRVGYSAHHGGYRMDWSQVPKEGPGPLLYVARGSHAGYFSYRPEGHPVINLRRMVNFPLISAIAERLGLRWLTPSLGLPALKRLRDHPPADPMLDPRAPPEARGVRLDPELRVLPEAASGVSPAPEADSDWWWLLYEGRWGSSRPRFTGTVGPDSPWRQGQRWSDPIAWLAGLDEA